MSQSLVDCDIDCPRYEVKENRVNRRDAKPALAEFRGVFSVGEFMPKPRPIVVGIGVLSGVLLPWN